MKVAELRNLIAIMADDVEVNVEGPDGYCVDVEQVSLFVDESGGSITVSGCPDPGLGDGVALLWRKPRRA